MDYVRKITVILDDVTKFCKVTADEKKLTIQLKDRVTNKLLILKNNKAISPEFHINA